MEVGFNGCGIIGNVVEKSFTGILRVSAGLSSCVAVMMVGELTIRMLANTLELMGYQAKKDSWVEKAANSIRNSAIRPYRDEQTKRLIIQTLAFAALGHVGMEFVRFVGGNAPGIYNGFLTLIGPFRITQGSSIGEAIALCGCVIRNVRAFC